MIFLRLTIGGKITIFFRYGNIFVDFFTFILPKFWKAAAKPSLTENWKAQSTHNCLIILTILITRSTVLTLFANLYVILYGYAALHFVNK